MSMSVGVDVTLKPNIDNMRIMLVNRDHKPEDKVTFVDCAISDEMAYILMCVFIRVVEAAQQHIKDNPPEWDKTVFG